MSAEKAILQALAKKNKRPSVKMANWEKAVRRPDPNAVVAWEVYANPKNVLTEKQTIAALQALALKGIVKIVIGGATNTVWWKLK